MTVVWRHDAQPNVTRYNDIQHNRLNCDNKENTYTIFVTS
jgi:hypothetical protein